MKFSLISATILATLATATNADPLEPYLWQNRPVVVFANTPNDLLFQRQMELLEDGKAELEDRDVIVIVDTDANAEETTELRKKLRPRGFQLVLIGKDGQVKLRKPRPWTVREFIPCHRQNAHAPTRTAPTLGTVDVIEIFANCAYITSNTDIPIQRNMT